MDQQIWDPLKSKLRDCFKAVLPRLDKKKGLFEILGCDFVFTENLEKSYLVEVHSNPAIFTTTRVLSEVVRKVVYKTLENV